LILGGNLRWLKAPFENRAVIAALEALRHPKLESSDGAS